MNRKLKMIENQNIPVLNIDTNIFKQKGKYKLMWV